MITIIHGEDSAASRNYYYQLRQQSKEHIVIDGISATSVYLQQALSGDDLFGVKKDIFIENLISKRKSAKEIEAFIVLLNTADTAIILWESKELTTKQVGLFKNATQKLFKIPSIIFAFLDALKPNNGKMLIQQFSQILLDKDPEFVLVMLQRQTRILLALQSNADSSISEVTRMAPWQKGKLEKQANLFTKEQLHNLHEKLFQLELGMKTGGLTFPLIKEIELLLLKL